MDDLGDLALLRTQAGVEKQAGHADDAVHRRADLVAHVGQELALQTRGLERGVAGAGDLLLLLLSFGDIHERAGEARERAAGLVPGQAGVEHPTVFSVVAAEPILELEALARHLEPRVLGAHAGEIVRV